MKFLIIFGIFAVLILLLYLRLRPYIRMARQMFGVARQVRRVVRDDGVTSLARNDSAGDRLVRCDSCETWIPASRALKLRSSSASYCSHDCLESMAEGSKRKVAS
ncbi:MAG TPA: hypothetical protein VJ715_04715 [Pyrinomonadaceae bacterium]|nr:hypothetical protein [Pyrinomonadaceae bacterium]